MQKPLFSQAMPTQWTYTGMKISAEATPTLWEILSVRTITVLLCKSWDTMESCVRPVHIPQILGIH